MLGCIAAALHDENAQPAVRAIGPERPWLTVTLRGAMDSLFFDIALPRLRGLTSFAATIGTERGCKCDIVTVRKGPIGIEIVYEPYGPPFCEVRFEDGPVRRIEIDVRFPSAERMGRGDKTVAAVCALEQDLRDYIDALYSHLERELR